MPKFEGKIKELSKCLYFYQTETCFYFVPLDIEYNFDLIKLAQCEN